MAVNGTSPLISEGARIGPVFSTNKECAFIKLSTKDNVRAVVNTNSMSLVEYAEPHNYPDGESRADPSLFVPIFCKECYDTNHETYEEALSNLTSSGTAKFLVGLCSVFGAGPDEDYPDSRKDYFLENETAYSGACHPQPGRSVFLHKNERDIGNVKCYWHVHSRSIHKTFLYCCVACSNTDYTEGLLKGDMSMGFSLGTVGDNKLGAVTEECSLVTVPMRPGCFCALAEREDLRSTMIRLGFSTLKDSHLDAGATNDSVHGTSENLTNPAGVSCPDSESIYDTVRFLRKAVTEQVTQVQLLKDLLTAITVQNSVLTQRLESPDDPDTLFTVRGAKDFTKRTGVKTKLCAGLPTEEHASDSESSQVHSHKQNMTSQNTQLETLISLLQQQQQPQPQQPQPQQQYQQLQSQLNTLQTQLIPILQKMTQSHDQEPWSGGIQHREPMRASGYHNVINEASGSFRSDTLTEDQKRIIAMEYNKLEAERQAVAQKEHDRMLDAIKASIRDVISEQQRSSAEASYVTDEPKGTLECLARGTPYNRSTSKRTKDISARNVLAELKELTKLIADRDTGSPNQPDAGAMDTDDPEPPNAAAIETVAQGSQMCVTKQQAGYKGPAPHSSSRKCTTTSPVDDFISAVVVKK